MHFVYNTRRRSHRSDRRVETVGGQGIRRRSTNGVSTDWLTTSGRRHVRYIGSLSVAWTCPLPSLASNWRSFNVHARLGIPLLIARSWRTTGCKPFVCRITSAINRYDISLTLCDLPWFSNKQITRRCDDATRFATKEPTMRFFHSPDGTALHLMNSVRYSDRN